MSAHREPEQTPPRRRRIRGEHLGLVLVLGGVAGWYATHFVPDPWPAAAALLACGWFFAIRAARRFEDAHRTELDTADRALDALELVTLDRDHWRGIVAQRGARTCVQCGRPLDQCSLSGCQGRQFAGWRETPG